MTLFNEKCILMFVLSGEVSNETNSQVPSRLPVNRFDIILVGAFTILVDKLPKTPWVVMEYICGRK